MKVEGNRMKSEKFPIYLTVILITGIFLVGSDELILSPLLPDLVDDLHSTFSIASLTVSLYGLAIGMVVPFISPFIDRIPRTRLMGLSLLCFSFASFVCAAAPNMIFMLTARFVSGVFAGIYIPSVYAYVADNVSFVYRGRVMGTVLSGWSLSLIIGIPLGAYIGEMLHWRWIFLIIGLLGIGVSAITLIYLPVEQKRDHSSSKNSKFFSHMLIALKEKQVGILIFTTFCNMFGFYGVYTFLGTFIRTTYSLDASESGKVILFYGIGIALSPLSGMAADYFGKKQSLAVAMFGLCMNIMLISMIKLPLFQLYFLLITWGALQSLVLTCLSSLLTDQSSEHRGKIMSLYSLATNLAVALGSWSMGLVYHAHGFQVIGIICGLISCLGGFIFLTTQLYHKNTIRLQDNPDSNSTL
jgi:MFS transporter, DHA1 family, inner membrane transport protein